MGVLSGTSDSAILYLVPNWNEKFENAKSRTITRCSFVCVPSKTDTIQMIRLLKRQDGTSIFAVWILILCALAEQSKPRRGYLTESGRTDDLPWTPEDLSLRWRRPVEEIKNALEVLSSPEIAFLIAQPPDNQSNTATLGPYPLGIDPVSSQCSNGIDPVSDQSLGGVDEQKRIESKRIELNQKEVRAPVLKKTQAPNRYSETFTHFWLDYPNKELKSKAWEVWQSIPQIEKDYSFVLIELLDQKSVWRQLGKTDIPRAFRWLSLRPWEKCKPKPSLETLDRDIAALSKMSEIVEKIESLLPDWDNPDLRARMVQLAEKIPPKAYQYSLSVEDKNLINDICKGRDPRKSIIRGD